MKKIKIVEHCWYKDLEFDIELDYYFDEELQEYLLDVELGNKNLQKIRDKYNELKKTESC